MININLYDTPNRKKLEEKGNYTVYEYVQDISVTPANAIQSCYASQMNLRKRQVVINLIDTDVIIQAGAMQWMAGDVSATTNIKGASNLIKKLASSKVTKENAIKPRYPGSNSCLVGNGYAVLESSVPREELSEVTLDNDVLKIDGNYAIAWSQSLNFTVERTTSSLIDSAASKERLVNVYRGSGKVLMAPL